MWYAKNNQLIKQSESLYMYACASHISVSPAVFRTLSLFAVCYICHSNKLDVLLDGTVCDRFVASLFVCCIRS